MRVKKKSQRNKAAAAAADGMTEEERLKAKADQLSTDNPLD